MTAQMLPGILSGHSAPVPGVFLLFTVMPRLRITVYFSAFFLFFLLIFFLSPKAVAAETMHSNISGRNYLLSGIKLRNFYRMIYMSNTDDRKILLQQTPDEMILQYAENRQALFNSAMDKDPSGLLCFSFIYPAEPDNGAVMTFLPAKETMPGLSQAETDALYTGIFLRLRHTYGDLLDEEEAETLEKDAILACEIKSALYQNILQLSPRDAAGVLRYIWGRDGIF